MMGGGPDLYTDAAPEAETPAEESEETPTSSEEATEPTAEIPKAVLGGKDFKPGEEVVLQVVQVMEDTVLVKYASEEGGGEEEGGEYGAPPAEPAGGGAPAGNPGLYD